MTNPSRHTRVALIPAVGALLAALALTGCLSARTSVSGLSPSAYELQGKRYQELGPAEGQSTSFNLFWILPVTPRVSYQAALENAIAKQKGDNLINVRVWKRREYWVVGTLDYLYVEGTVIKYDDGAPEARAKVK